MEINEYRIEFLNTIRNEANLDGNDVDDQFVNSALAQLEEMGELIVAINKLKRKLYHNEYKDRDVMQEVVEEMTDVKMSIEQIELTFLKDQNFDAMLNKKCTKLKNLIEKMKAEK